MNHIPFIIDTLKYVEQFSGTRLLIKLGGSILDDAEQIKSLCADLSLMTAIGMDIVIVHGGSRAIEKHLTAHKLSWEFHQGQRITTVEMIEIIEMVLCGHMNNMLVRTLNAMQHHAVGFSGTDNRMLLAERFDPILGEVGKIKAVNPILIEQCLDARHQRQQIQIPVIAPIGIDEQGKPLNINADWAAVEIAKALNIEKIIYLTDQDGILDANGQLISSCSIPVLSALIETGVAKSGMLTKVSTIIAALEQGVKAIHILNAKRPHVLIEELFTADGIGTLCHREI